MKRNQKNFHVLLKSIFLNICKILIPVEVTRGETVNTAIVDIYDSDEGCDPFLKMRVGSQTLPISFCLQTDHLKQFAFQLCGQVALYTPEKTSTARQVLGNCERMVFTNFIGNRVSTFIL